MSASQRAKGGRGELEIVHILHAAGWPDARRTSDGRTQSSRGDIAAGPAGCHIEIKRKERLDVPGSLRQVQAEALPGDIPILVHRSSRQEWQATLSLDALLPLLRLREPA